MNFEFLSFGHGTQRYFRQSIVLIPLLVLLGTTFHSIRGSILGPRLCGHNGSDIQDEAVLKLNFELPKEPSIPLAKAWLKAEAGAIMCTKFYHLSV